MKKIALTLFTLFFLMASLVTVFADRDLPLLVDDADLLTDVEEKRIESKLERISDDQECEVAIVTVYSLDGKTATEYADDFFDYNGYGYGNDDDGVLLLVSMEDSDLAISTHGYAITAFTDIGLNYMADEFVPYLSSGDFEEAFSLYADLCDDLLTQARNGSPYGADSGSSGSEKKGFSPKRLLVSFGIGAVISFIITGIMKGQLKTVRFQPAATSYVKNDSLNITISRDLFLYRKVDRRAIPKNNSSSSSGSSVHRSSSGRSHGGISRKF
ncbi:MAG: TPM domain-containing protein [Clostridiaceae bacterium]|nr:TPM domain-containing protein [Clostridiaceae bacterium]